MKKAMANFFFTSIFLFILIIFLGAFAGCNNKKQGQCVSMPCPQKHARIDFSTGLNQNGKYILKVITGKKRETCSLTIKNFGPATRHGNAVQSPSTRTSTNCTTVKSGGYKNSGKVAGLKTTGTPKSLSIKINYKGKVIAKDSFKLKYKTVYPFGRHCHSCIRADATLKVAY